jgi:hypothetical protein
MGRYHQRVMNQRQLYYQRTGVDVQRVLTIAFRILTALMFFSGVFGLLQYRRDLQTAKWPSVEGVILHAQTQQCYIRGDPAGLLPDVAYKYVVNGREWIGKRIDIKNNCVVDEVERNYVAKFPVHSKILVFYDPASPGESLLHPGPGTEQVALFHLAEILIGLSTLLAVFFLWDSREKREKTLLVLGAGRRPMSVIAMLRESTLWFAALAVFVWPSAKCET